MQINNILSLEPIRYKIDLIKDDIYQCLKDNVYNFPESNLMTYIKLGYSYQSYFNKKGRIISGKVISKSNLILELNSIGQEVILLHGNLSNTNNLIYTNDISPYFRGKWKNIANLINDENISIELFTFNGISIPLSGCYIKSSLTNNNVLYIKILNKMFTNLNNKFGIPIFLKLYKNSPNNKIIYSYNPLINEYSDISNVENILNILNNLSNEQFINTILNINGYIYYDIEYGINKINNILSDENLLKHSYIELIIDNTIIDEFRFNNLPDITYKDVFDNEKIIIHPDKDFLNDKVNTLDNIELWLIDNISKNGIRIPYISKPIINKFFNDIFEQLNNILSINNNNNVLIDFRYYNYFNISSTYNQLTHRDYSLSKSYIDYVKHLINPNSNDFSLILKYRFIDKNKKIDKNGDLIEFIYNNKTNDNDIILSLTNNHTLDIFNECFNAKILEYSTYIKSLLDLPDNLNSYEIFNIALNSLGYLNFVEKICKSIYHINYNDIENNQYIIEKSIFYKYEPCSVIIFLNGQLLHNNFHYYYEDSDNYITVTFYPNVINENDELVIEVIPYIEADINLSPLLSIDNYIQLDSLYSSVLIDYFNYIFEISLPGVTTTHLQESLNYEPLNFDNSILIEYNDRILKLINTRLTQYDIYLKIEDKSDNKTYNLKHLPFRYKLLDPIDNEYFIIEKDYKNKSIKYKFNDSSINKTFVFYPKNYYSIHIKKYNIKYPSDELINFQLKFNDIPILNIEDDIRVYINGKEVYQNIDYKITKITNIDGTVSGYWFTYQSLKHLELFNNIDIFIVSTKSYSILDEKYFGIDDYISYNGKLNIKELNNYLISINGYTYNLNNLEILDGCIRILKYYDNLTTAHLLPYYIRFVAPSIIDNIACKIENIQNNELLSTLVGNNQISKYTSKLLSGKDYFNTNLITNKNLKYHDYLERLLSEGYDKLNQDVYNIQDPNYNQTELFNYLKSNDNVIFSSFITKINKLILEREINIKCNITEYYLQYIETKYRYLKQYDLLFDNHSVYKDSYLVYSSLFSFYDIKFEDLIQPYINITPYPERKFDYDTSGKIIFRGYAALGTNTNEAGWYIEKFIYDENDNLIDILQANGETEFNKIWDNRETYNYI